MITVGGNRNPAKPDGGNGGSGARRGRRRIGTACPTSPSADATVPDPDQRIHQSRPDRGRGYRAGYCSQQQPEPAPSPDGQGRLQLPGHHGQLARAADHRDRLDLDSIEAVDAGDEAGHLRARGDQHSGAVGRLQHDVAERAEGRHRPVSDDHPVSGGHAEGGDLAVEPPACGHTQPPWSVVSWPEATAATQPEGGPSSRRSRHHRWSAPT